MSKEGSAGDDAVCCCCWGDAGDDDTAAAAACEPFGCCIPLLEYVCSPTTLHPDPD